MTEVLDHGFVELVHHCGGDLSVVNAARVSFGKNVVVLSEGDKKLIAYLMRERHGTPFEHNFFSFRIKAPIFVFREWHRHRVGISINEISGRYTELPEEWYIPETKDVRCRKGAPGHYEYVQASSETAEDFLDSLDACCITSYNDYKRALQRGVAPELARMLLHVNHFSEMIWSCNARSLMHFLGLRNAPNAQWEIQQYAKALEFWFEKYMPVTHEAFVNNGRVSP